MQSELHRNVLKTAVSVLLQPGHFYRRITELDWLPSTILLFAAVLGLLRWPILFLAGIGGYFASAFLFAFVYLGVYRHQGIWLTYLVALYWIGFARDRVAHATSPAWFHLPARAGFLVAMPILLIINDIIGVQKLAKDVRHEMSKSAALAAVVTASPALRSAILTAEPDETVEALRHYLPNRSYLLRENRFGSFATWSDDEQRALSLDDVLRQMRALRRQYGVPVIIALSVPITTTDDGGRQEGAWGRTFTYTLQEARDFLAAVRKIPLGPESVYEHFDAYVLD